MSETEFTPMAKLEGLLPVDRSSLAKRSLMPQAFLSCAPHDSTMSRAYCLPWRIWYLSIGPVGEGRRGSKPVGPGAARGLSGFSVWRAGADAGIRVRARAWWAIGFIMILASKEGSG